MTTITATWPDGDVLVWTDGVLSTPGAISNTKLLAFDELTGYVQATEGEGPAVDIEDIATNPYAFLGGVRRLSDELLYPRPEVISDSRLPDLGPGGIEAIDEGPA